MWALLTGLLAFCAPSAFADDFAKRRIVMGAQVFVGFLASDLDLPAKRTTEGKVHVVLLYRENLDTAAAAAERLSRFDSVKGAPIKISFLPFSRLADLEAQPPAGLFLADSSPEELERLINFAVRHRRLVFSPFKGDVTKGIPVGVSITDRVLPLVNPQTLQSAGIRLKPFLLEASKTDE